MRLDNTGDFPAAGKSGSAANCGVLN